MQFLSVWSTGSPEFRQENKIVEWREIHENEKEKWLNWVNEENSAIESVESSRDAEGCEADSRPGMRRADWRGENRQGLE